MTRSRILVTVVAIGGLALATSACASSTSSAPAASASVQAKGDFGYILDGAVDVAADCAIDPSAPQLYFGVDETYSCPNLDLTNRYVMIQSQGMVDLSGSDLTSARLAIAGSFGDINLQGANLSRVTLTIGDIGSGTLDLTGANLSNTNLKSLVGTVLTDETTVFCHTNMPKTGKVNDRDCT